MAVTREQAEAVLAAVQAKYAPDLNGENAEYGPKLIEDWDWLSSPTKWAIIWEEGPFEWAYRFGMGGLNEEMYNALLESSGNTVEGRAKAYEMAMEKPADDIPGVWTEAITAWAISVNADV